MEKFYVAQDGIQKGPWTLSDISLKLKQKELQWNDYIYDQKIEDWVLLLEFPMLTELFNKSFSNPINETKKLKDVSVAAPLDPYKDRAWYILKQGNNYGPFSKHEMVQMLQSKTLFEFDFVWKKDQEAWKRLADIPEFSQDQIRELFQSWTPEKDGELFFRRRHARAGFSSHVIVHDKKKVFRAQSLEISEGGAGLIVPDSDFPIGHEVHLHFRPNKEVPAFNSICRIVSKSGSKYGVQFTHISTGAKDSISKYTKKAA